MEGGREGVRERRLKERKKTLVFLLLSLSLFSRTCISTRMSRGSLSSQSVLGMKPGGEEGGVSEVFF